MNLLLEAGEMREGDQSTREQMETLVCMSLEEMKSSVYTVRVVAVTTHQDCGDVTYLILVERCRVSTSTSATGDHMVGNTTSFCATLLHHWNTGQLNPSVSMNFTLHTEPRASVPEFTISCRTHGGPATTVQWTVNGVSVQEDSDHETSQLILDTSLNSVYDNRLRVRGRRNGTYFCSVKNNIKFYLRNRTVDNVNTSEILLGKLDDEVYKHGLSHSTVAGEPTSLTAVISESNSTHVNITVSWESPGDPVTDYVIYYQSKGGPVISDRVSGGETETHSLDGLQRGVTYYISIVALSPHLPSPLVGPTTVAG